MYKCNYYHKTILTLIIFEALRYFLFLLSFFSSFPLFLLILFPLKKKKKKKEKLLVSPHKIDFMIIEFKK